MKFRAQLSWVWKKVYNLGPGSTLFYPQTKSEGYSFGVVRPSVRPSIPSVRPHFLSVRNHISVPISQIKFILSTND